MDVHPPRSPMERLVSAVRSSRPVLWAVALVGLLVLNSVYVFYTVARPEVSATAMANPVSLVFMGEALLLLALCAWIIWRAGFRRPGWVAFVVMAIAGTLAFALPAFLLLHLRSAGRPPSAPRPGSPWRRGGRTRGAPGGATVPHG